MESYVYLVLAAAEVDDSGRLQIGDDVGDPRLNRPASGFYAHVHGTAAEWSSPSSLGMRLPELGPISAGRAEFSKPGRKSDYYSYQYGVAWQIETGLEIPLSVSVMVDPAEVEREASAFRLGLWRALGSAGAILLFATSLLIYLGFRPLQKIADDIAGVESGRAERLQGGYPRELEPLARNINHLLDTEQLNQQRYRNALDSLAHSLKTPLAILRAGLESNSPESRHAMRRAADEMNQLVATRLQRAAVSARRTLGPPVQVQEEAQRVMASLRKVHSHKLISTEVNIHPDAAFFGEKRDLLELLGNLLDNAFKYGRSKVGLAAGPLAGEASRPGLWIKVEDDGPGIEPRQWPVLLRRGVRGDEREEGYGLGLAIVLELMTAYGGTIEIGRSQWGGALISLEFPAT